MPNVHGKRNAPYLGRFGEGMLAGTKGLVNDALGPYPPAEDKAVIVNRTRILLFQTADKIYRQKGVIVNRVRLVVNVRFAVQKLFEPVQRPGGVACAVKHAGRLVKAAFQHREHFLAPCGHLVAVAVFHAGTLDARNARLFVRAQHIYLLAKQFD